ncbi:MAG TPA: 6-carboxytetrahydropterin synthase [Sphingobacteriaceae bacterium]
MYELSKTFRFEAAHRLAKGFTGKCANIHGHSWNGKLTVETSSLDEFDFGVDYSILGKFTKEIEGLLDHQILLYADDGEVVDFVVRSRFNHVLFEHNPTCETIARWIWQRAMKYFQDMPDVRVRYVEVSETCTTGCRYSEKVQ